MFGFVSLAVVLCAQQVAAHGGVLSYTIAGKNYNGFVPYNTATGQTSIQRPWATYNPIQSATDPTLACNDDGSSLALQLSATATAGSSVTAWWNNPWPHNTGPVLTYLAKCPGSTCTGVDATSLQWFKIQEAGLLSGTVYNGQWAAGKMIAQNNSWTTTIPASVPSGSYLIRFETIALHSMPAQFYPECAQIDITGGGSRAPLASELVKFPGGYSQSDPGVTIDIYGVPAQTQTTYVIPGPPLYGTGGSTGGSTPTTAPSGTPPTTTKPAQTSAPAGTVPHYGQCGGQGWTGATACVAPYVCTSSSVYYSQCL